MKRAIIVGATSGIGRKLAEILVEKGYLVGITGRRQELLAEIKTQNPTQFITQPMDVTDLSATTAQLEALRQELGGLDLLILSSGTGDLNPQLSMAIEKQTIQTNVLGFTNVVDWAFTYFEQQKHGHLVAISSIAGVRGGGLAPAYNASKAYQINYLEGLRQKAAKLPIQLVITDIRPGLVNTEMAKGDKLTWVMPVHKIAKQIMRAINSKKHVVYVSKRWGLMARLLKILPNSMYEKM
jgi:short-subunit dehydrogenase